MASNNSTPPKRFRSDESSINSQSTLSDDHLSCPFCTYDTTSQDDFDFHNHIHHQHLCSQCLRLFPSYFLLDLHMDEVHNNYLPNRSYRCLLEACPKSFVSLEQRSQHINHEHHTINRSLTEIYLFFSQPIETMKTKGHETKFGCDSEKTFVRNSRLKPRQLIPTHWDGDEE